jgi:hypothetical protein
MSTLKLTDGAVTNGVLVVGLSFNPNKDSRIWNRNFGHEDSARSTKRARGYR